ncbi:hypothetical protein F4777DRAFT_599703 [Nemania sp. FL0916]|nr:hypothetical protein F4777DRAFT_599703 [Nemania sp. FL0916]
MLDIERDSTKWTVTKDPTIAANGPSYGVEIVTPIFYFDLGTTAQQAAGSWEFEIRRVWGTIDRYFDVITNDEHDCGTHIHISPPDVRPVPSLVSLASTTSLQDVVNMTMPRDEDERRIELADKRYVAWNFLPLLGPKGTIEFRQPRHVTTAEEAATWIIWAVGLCVSGLNYSI